MTLEEFRFHELDREMHRLSPWGEPRRELMRVAWLDCGHYGLLGTDVDGVYECRICGKKGRRNNFRVQTVRGG